VSEIVQAGTITAVRRQHWYGWEGHPDWEEWDLTSTDGYIYYLPLIEDTPRIGDRLTVWLASPGGPALAFSINDGPRVPLARPLGRVRKV
jgi:hypothetical protein